MLELNTKPISTTRAKPNNKKHPTLSPCDMLCCFTGGEGEANRGILSKIVLNLFVGFSDSSRTAGGRSPPSVTISAPMRFLSSGSFA